MVYQIEVGWLLWFLNFVLEYLSIYDFYPDREYKFHIAVKKIITISNSANFFFITLLYRNYLKILIKKYKSQKSKWPITVLFFIEIAVWPIFSSE